MPFLLLKRLFSEREVTLVSPFIIEGRANAPAADGKQGLLPFRELLLIITNRNVYQIFHLFI